MLNILIIISTVVCHGLIIRRASPTPPLSLGRVFQTSLTVNTLSTALCTPIQHRRHSRARSRRPPSFSYPALRQTPETPTRRPT